MKAPLTVGKDRGILEQDQVAHEPVELATNLSVIVKLGWAVGATGPVTMVFMVNLLVMAFMITHLGIPAALAGLIIFLTRIFDMVTDPLMGWLSDRLATRWGRRRPWMFLGALLSAATVVALFNVPRGAADGDRIAYMGVVLILFFVGYTLFSVPFTSMAAEMTRDYHERTSLMSYRTFFSNLGGMLGGSAAPIVVGWLGSTQAAYGQMAWIMGSLVLITMMASVVFSARAPFTQPTPVRYSVADYIKTVLSNRPFFLLVLVKLIQLFAISSTLASSFFFITDVLGRDETLLGVLALVFNLEQIQFSPDHIRRRRSSFRIRLR